MAQIMVRAKPGRVAFTAPKNGVKIPEDNFIPVNDGEWIRRLASVHGDIEIQSESAPAPSKKTAGTSGA
ncbi:MAG: hypothetical protein ACRCYS_17040 [Beijerinckiaceae bacterium]